MPAQVLRRAAGALALAAAWLTTASVAAADPRLHGAFYLQVVTPTDDLNPLVKQWHAQVRGGLTRLVRNLAEAANEGVPKPQQVKPEPNDEADAFIGSRYSDDDDFGHHSAGWNAIQLSVMESFKDHGKTATTTYVFFGPLKGRLPKVRIDLAEPDALASPDRSASELGYMFAYAWAMDFVSVGQFPRACRLLDQATRMSTSQDLKGNQRVAPLTAAIKASYSEHCAARARSADAG
jgi:hypothetical protein